LARKLAQESILPRQQKDPCVSTWWASTQKNRQIEAGCRKLSDIYVSIGDLFQNPENSARGSIKMLVVIREIEAYSASRNASSKPFHPRSEPSNRSVNVIRRTIETTAQLYKEGDYHLDSALPTSALLGLVARRSVACIRGLVRSLARPSNPRSWVFVEAGVVIRNRKLVSIGRGSSLGRHVVIDGLSRSGVSIGERVSIGHYSIIEATGVVTSLGKGCSIGNDSGFVAFSHIGAAGGVRIGKNVIMGQRGSFQSANHVISSLDIPIRLQGVTRAGIVVELDCWVGANVTVLDGAHVEKRCVIAAGAVVRGRVPAYSVAGDVPARIIRSRTERAEL